MISTSFYLSPQTLSEYRQIIHEAREFLQVNEPLQAVYDQAVRDMAGHHKIKTPLCRYGNKFGTEAISCAKSDIKFFSTAINNYHAAKSGKPPETLQPELRPVKKLISYLDNKKVPHTEIARVGNMTHQDIQLIYNQQRAHPGLVAKAPAIEKKLKKYIKQNHNHREMAVAV